MATLSNKSLIFLEDLTLPKFQVIVTNGNTGCGQRVFQVISKMRGLREYTVDVQKKQVIVKGDVRIKQNQENNYAINVRNLGERIVFVPD